MQVQACNHCPMLLLLHAQLPPQVPKSWTHGSSPSCRQCHAPHQQLDIESAVPEWQQHCLLQASKCYQSFPEAVVVVVVAGAAALDAGQPLQQQQAPCQCQSLKLPHLLPVAGLLMVMV